MKEINDIKSLDQLDNIRGLHGKKGAITSLLKNISSQTIEVRKDFGEQVNALRDKSLTKLKSVNQLCSKRRSQKISQDVIDVTLPLTNTNLENGKIHPIN